MSFRIHVRAGELDWTSKEFTDDFDFVEILSLWRQAGGVLNPSTDFFVPWHKIDYVEKVTGDKRGFVTDIRRRMTE